MSTNTYIPFNYQPASTTPRSGSYTIPTGKYALVTAMTPNFSINGTALYGSGSMATITASANSSATSHVQINDIIYISATITRSGAGAGLSSAIGYIGMTIPGGGLHQIATQATSANASIGFSATVPPGTIYWGCAMGNNGDATLSGTYYYFTGNRREFWVAPGTVLAGISYVVTEYNTIG